MKKLGTIIALTTVLTAATPVYAATTTSITQAQVTRNVTVTETAAFTDKRMTVAEAKEAVLSKSLGFEGEFDLIVGSRDELEVLNQNISNTENISVLLLNDVLDFELNNTSYYRLQDYLNQHGGGNVLYAYDANNPNSSYTEGFQVMVRGLV